MTMKTRRAIKLEGTDVTLELSKFATPRTDKEFIHLDKLKDGTWRLLYNVKDTDIQSVSSLVIVRED